MLREFKNRERKYQAWLRSHPDGYVLNTRRSPDPDYMVLHRARCRTISQYHAMARPGGYTERDFIKVCADSEAELRAWVKAHGRRDGSFSKECGFCIKKQ